MVKAKKSAFVRLSEDAITSMSSMLAELFKDDEHLKINHSRLASHILIEYHRKYFEKAKPRLVQLYQDKKKHLKNAIESLDSDELEAAFKYLDKIKKADSSEEKSQKN